MRFGKLTVLYRGASYTDSLGRSRFRWVCRCDCGACTEVRPDKLTSGATTSCGCYQREVATKIGYMSRKHGCGGDTTRERLYVIWSSMNERCRNPNNDAYQDYGGRGIKVCNDWRSFEGFLDWASHNGYKDSLTIDRVNVNGGYEPENCRWATAKEQANNKRSNRFLTYQGATKTLSEWSEASGISAGTIAYRLKSGWSIEEALTTPSRKGGK